MTGQCVMLARNARAVWPVPRSFGHGHARRRSGPRAGPFRRRAATGTQRERVLASRRHEAGALLGNTGRRDDHAHLRRPAGARAAPRAAAQRVGLACRHGRDGLRRSRSGGRGRCAGWSIGHEAKRRLGAGADRERGEHGRAEDQNATPLLISGSSFGGSTAIDNACGARGTPDAADAAVARTGASASDARGDHESGGRRAGPRQRRRNAIITCGADAGRPWTRAHARPLIGAPARRQRAMPRCGRAQTRRIRRGRGRALQRAQTWVAVCTVRNARCVDDGQRPAGRRPRTSATLELRPAGGRADARDMIAARCAAHRERSRPKNRPGGTRTGCGKDAEQPPRYTCRADGKSRRPRSGASSNLGASRWGATQCALSPHAGARQLEEGAGRPSIVFGPGAGGTGWRSRDRAKILNVPEGSRARGRQRPGHRRRGRSDPSPPGERRIGSTLGARRR